MTYNPQVYVNDYYSRDPKTGTNAVGIDSMPRSNASVLRSFTTAQFPVGTAFSIAIKPQINMSNLQYIDFYGNSGATTNVATFRWEIKQANITGTTQLGGSITNGMTKTGGGTATSITTPYASSTPTGTPLSMPSTTLTKYTGTFTDAFNLEAGSVYYVDCICVAAASSTTTSFIGTSLGTSDETFYRDKITITGANLSTTSPHVTIPSGFAGSLYSGMRVVHANINSGNGANIDQVLSTTTFNLSTVPSSAATNTTIYAYDLTRSVVSGAGTFTGTTDTNKPTNVDFIPFIRIRGSG
jgi:hypothetical protein